MQLFSLTQVVQGTTHSSSSGRETLLDIALVSTPAQLNESSIIPQLLTLTTMVSFSHGTGGFRSTALNQLHEQYGSTLMPTLTEQMNC